MFCILLEKSIIFEQLAIGTALKMFVMNNKIQRLVIISFLMTQSIKLPITLASHVTKQNSMNHYTEG